MLSLRDSLFSFSLGKPLLIFEIFGEKKKNLGKRAFTNVGLV
jgi:hypothetical protein